jgi:NADH dehydrogenase
MILVVGATGQLGGLIARSLLQNRRPVRILARSGSYDTELASAGAETVTGDLKDFGSLRKACAGVNAVVTTANSTARGGEDTVETVDRTGNRNLIEAAAAAGVRRFLFVSVLGASPDHPVPLMRAKGETERLLRDAGMAWTVLQPNLFMDKLPMAVVGGPVLAGQPVTLVGEGRRQHSLVTMRDVAAFALAALDRSDAMDQTLLLGGPHAVSMRDVVAAFEQELGREVPVQTVPFGQPVPGMPPIISELLTALETYDSPLDMTDLAAAYRIRLTTLADFVRSFVAAHGQVAPI